MKCRWISIAVFGAAVAMSLGGTVFEFDGKAWDQGQTRKLRKERNTVCLIAPAATRMGQFADLLPQVYSSPFRSLKLQLRGQGTSVTIKRPGPEFHRTMERFAEGGGDGHLVFATTGPVATFVSTFKRGGNAAEGQSRLNPDLEGVQHFLNAAAAGFEPAGEGEAKSVPPLALIARSDCSLGQLVTVLQLLKQAGAETAAIVVNDEIPEPYVEVIMDKHLHIPVAPKARSIDRGQGKIVIEIDANSKLTAEDGTALSSDEEVSQYLKARKSEWIKAGVDPRVHLRGDRNSLFSSSRRIIRLAAKLDLDEVIFVGRAPGEKIQRRERDLEMALPSVMPNGEFPPAKPFFIKIDKKGAIFVNSGPAEEALDQDPAQREAPLLNQRLDMYVAAAKAAGVEPLVQLHVEGDTRQQRVVDVLNALARVGVSKVTFTDLVEEE